MCLQVSPAAVRFLCRSQLVHYIVNVAADCMHALCAQYVVLNVVTCLLLPPAAAPCCLQEPLAALHCHCGR